MTGRAEAQSLRRRLVWRLVPLQAALLALLTLLVMGTLFGTGLLLNGRDEERVIDVVSQALSRDAQGGLVLRSTAALQELRSETPDLWFLVHDTQGHSISEGAVPTEFAKIGNALDSISQARLGWQMFDDDPRKPAARMKRVNTNAGTVFVLTATQGPMSTAKALQATLIAFASFALPSLLLMTLATFMATPVVVRLALAGLDAAADRARQINMRKPGTRLPLADVPAEVSPLVRAVNDALERLDQDYARHQRFVADAAHELRTPIAILNTRLEGLPPSPDRDRLLEDTARLATLAEQLLDIQRLDRHRNPFVNVDLVALGRQVAADLAPLAIAAGYDIAFETEADRVETSGDHGALERALNNLVQNAIQHGGRRGTIGISVSRPATINVTDQGAGIPADQRALIFEPFYRLHPLGRGAGLGLNMVREIVRMHGGEVTVRESPDGGACFSLELRPR
jgi:signal transduction histidine kinase